MGLANNIMNAACTYQNIDIFAPMIFINDFCHRWESYFEIHLVIFTEMQQLNNYGHTDRRFFYVYKANVILRKLHRFSSYER